MKLILFRDGSELSSNSHTSSPLLQSSQENQSNFSNFNVTYNNCIKH